MGRHAVIAGMLVAVIGLGGACANRVQSLPTPTIEAQPAIEARGAAPPTVVTGGPTATPEGRATPELASDSSEATAATPAPTPVGGGSDETFHFRGPEDAGVTVAEFADFQ